MDGSGQQQQRQRKQEHTRAQLWRRFFLVAYAGLQAYLTKQLAAAVQFQEADPFSSCKENMSGFQASG